MLQNAKVTAFTVSELLRENQQQGRGRGITPPSPTQIRVKAIILYSVHSISFVKYVFSPMIRFMKTSTRIMKYESQVVKSKFYDF